MKTYKIFVVFVLFFQISVNVYSNNSDESKLRVFNQDTIYFLGYDFSLMQYSIFEKPVRNLDVAYTIDAWIGYQKFYITPQTTLKRWLRMPNVVPLPCFFGCQSDQNKNWITRNANYEVSEDSIQQVIKGYDTPVKNGVGFVVHVINLNKVKEFAFSQFTFFDLSTGEILWTELAKGRPDEHGFNKYWGSAIHFSIKDFIDRCYIPEYNHMIRDAQLLQQQAAEKEKKEAKSKKKKKKKN